MEKQTKVVGGTIWFKTLGQIAIITKDGEIFWVNARKDFDDFLEGDIVWILYIRKSFHNITIKALLSQKDYPDEQSIKVD